MQAVLSSFALAQEERTALLEEQLVARRRSIVYLQSNVISTRANGSFSQDGPTFDEILDGLDTSMIRSVVIISGGNVSEGDEVVLV